MIFGVVNDSEGDVIGKTNIDCAEVDDSEIDCAKTDKAANDRVKADIAEFCRSRQ